MTETEAIEAVDRLCVTASRCSLGPIRRLTACDGPP